MCKTSLSQSQFPEESEDDLRNPEKSRQQFVLIMNGKSKYRKDNMILQVKQQMGGMLETRTVRVGFMDLIQVVCYIT